MYSSIVSRVHNVFPQIHPVSKKSVTDAGGYHVFNIYSRVISGSTWSVLHPVGPPSGSPQFLVKREFGPHPQRLIRTPVKGGYPRYHSILSFPGRASLLVPLPLDLSAFLPPVICPLIFCVFSVWYTAKNLYAKPSADREILLTICLVPRPHYSAQINDHF